MAKIDSVKRKERLNELKKFLLQREGPFDSLPNVSFEGEILCCNARAIRHLVFESGKLLEEILEASVNAGQKGKIGEEALWMGVYYGLEIERNAHPRFCIKDAGEGVGLGLFAAERIKRGAFLGEYAGVVQKRRLWHRSRKASYVFRYGHGSAMQKRYVIDAENLGNFTRFINHSVHPNAKAVCVNWKGMPRILFVSLRDIEEDEQICFDYGRIYWRQKRGLFRWRRQDFS